MTSSINKIYQKGKEYITPVGILFGIYLFGISAILKANFNYIDDMGRVFAGYRGWSNFSRYTSSVLSIFLHTDTYLTDISPLPQVLACLLIAVSVVIVLHLVTKKKKFSFSLLITGIFLGLNPYFLECLSYKYDAPYMAFSILVSILPFLFYKKNHVLFGMSTFLGMILVCTTYQVSVGIFPMFLLFLVLKEWNEKNWTKESQKTFFIGIVGYGFSLIFFKCFLMKEVNTYVSTIMPTLKNIFPTILQNYNQYFSLILSDFKIEWLILMGMIIMFSLFSIVKNSKENKIKSLGVSFLLLILMFLLSFGIYPLLSKPLFSPRAFYGVGVFLFLITIEIMNSKKGYIGKGTCLILAYMFFLFSFTYGNALFVQKTYTNFRIEQTIEDLKSLGALNKEPIIVQVNGTIGQSPVLRNMPQDYQILNRLVPISFGNSFDSWAIYGFDNYYNLKNMTLSQEDLTNYKMPILLNNIYNTIRGEKNHFVIELKE